MPYTEPSSPSSASSGLSSLITSPRMSISNPPPMLPSVQQSKMAAQQELQNALERVERDRERQRTGSWVANGGGNLEDRVEEMKEDVVTPGANIPGPSNYHQVPSSRRNFYIPSSTASSSVGSGPSTPTGPTLLPRRQSSSRNGSRQTSPLSTPNPYDSFGTASNQLPGVPRRSSSSMTTTPTNGLMSGIDRRGRKSEVLGLKGMGRSIRDSQSSISTVESSAPSTPMDEITLSLQRYALEQEAAEKRRGSTKGRRTSEDLDVGLDPEEELLPTTPIGHRIEGLPSRSPEKTKLSLPDAAGLPAPVKEKESVIPFPKSPAEESPTKVPMPAAPLKSPTMTHRVINPRHPARTGPSLGLRRQPSSSLQLDIPATPPLNPGWQTESSSRNSPIHTPSWSGHRPTSSMIRKKSGELLKPSLKTRSQSTPHLPLPDKYKGTKSEPPTPSIDGHDFGSDRHKNVRFAGSSGDKRERLESVVLFLREQKVTAVSKTADGEDGMYPATETETEAEPEGIDYVSFRTKRLAQAQAHDQAERFVFGESTSVVPKVRCDFSPSNKGSLADHTVILERVDMPNNGSDGLALRGNVLVRNLSFQKWVALRFTLDGWQTVSEVAGSHVSHLPTSTTGDEGWDRFSFIIKLEDFKRKIEEKELLLCVRFSVEGREWWDTNIGDNYRFNFRKVKPARRSRMFEIGSSNGADSPPQRAIPFPTPPLPGMRASSFGRATGWNFPGMGSPNSSPSKGVLGQVNSPSPPAIPSEPSPDVPAFRVAGATTISSPPAFPVPKLPDVHDHLKLKAYCAPTLPLSPPKEDLPVIKTPGKDDVPDLEPSRGRQPAMSMVINGQYATTLPPPFENKRGHERRRSWGGEVVDDETMPAWRESTGDSPPVVTTIVQTAESSIGSASSTLQEQEDFGRAGSSATLSHTAKGLDLFTPPSSALSTPPLPSMLPVPESPSTASASPVSETGSPAEEMISLPEVVIDGNERDRRLEEAAQNHSVPNESGIHSPSYKEFIEKYCFFQSRSQSAASPVHSRSTTPTGGVPTVNPYGPSYPTFTPAGQTTPTGPSPTADNYFSFDPNSVYWSGYNKSSSNSSNSTGGSNTPNFGGVYNPEPFIASH